MDADGLPETNAIKPSHEGLVKIRATDLRAIGLQIGPDRLPDNPYHGQVWGVGKSHRKQIPRRNILIVNEMYHAFHQNPSFTGTSSC